MYSLKRLDNELSIKSKIGDKRHLGAITKCSNSRARRLLVEGAHAYKHSADISKAMQLRQEAGRLK